MKSFKLIYPTLLFSFLILIACSKDDSSKSGGNNNTTTNPVVKCDTSVVGDATSGGCNARLVTPVMCETIDLRNGKTYEFAWTTDGTTCETPWNFQIGGNPVTQNNIKSWSLSTNVNEGITGKGGIVRINAQTLDGLTTDNGLYHWVVESYYGSHPASKTFKVLK